MKTNFEDREYMKRQSRALRWWESTNIYRLWLDAPHQPSVSYECLGVRFPKIIQMLLHFFLGKAPMFLFFSKLSSNHVQVFLNDIKNATEIYLESHKQQSVRENECLKLLLLYLLEILLCMLLVLLFHLKTEKQKQKQSSIILFILLLMPTKIGKTLKWVAGAF